MSVLFLQEYKLRIFKTKRFRSIIGAFYIKNTLIICKEMCDQP